MEWARDKVTDQLVSADAALPLRRYRCWNCGAPVYLRAGPERRAHFAHDAGAADPECVAFHPSALHAGGWRARAWGASEREGSLEISRLYFDIEIEGPQLFLWLPPSAGTGAWTGAIRIEADRTSQRLTAQHLHRGKMVKFPLVSGQWEIRLAGEVSEDYQSRLDVGTSALESACNVFDATHSPGPAVGPSGAVRLGDPIWVVTRRGNFGEGTVDKRAGRQRCAEIGGWFVDRIVLPREASRAESIQWSDWLERQVRSGRSRTFIAAPWPCGFEMDGKPVYPLLSEGISIVSEDSADLEIRDQQGSLIVRAHESIRLWWEEPREGTWTVFVNGVEFSRFAVARQPPSAPPAITARLGSAPSSDLYSVQQGLERLSDTELPADLNVCFSHPAIARRFVDPQESSAGETLLYFPAGATSVSLTAGHLGTLKWPTVTRHPPTEVPRRPAPRYGLARWLLSHALPLGTQDGLSIVVPPEWHADPVIAPLRGRQWPITLQGQIQLLLRSLTTRL